MISLVQEGIKWWKVVWIKIWSSFYTTKFLFECELSFLICISSFCFPFHQLRQKYPIFGCFLWIYAEEVLVIPNQLGRGEVKSLPTTTKRAFWSMIWQERQIALVHTLQFQINTQEKNPKLSCIKRSPYWKNMPVILSHSNVLQLSHKVTWFLLFVCLVDGIN